MIAAATRATSTTISDEPVAQTEPALRSRFSIDNTNHLDVSMVEKSHSVIISLRIHQDLFTKNIKMHMYVLTFH